VATLALGIELSRARAANSDLEQVNRELQERVHQLATAQQNLARELYDRRDLPRSLEEFSVALQLREQLYAAQPTDVRRFELVEAWGSVALAQHKSKNLRSATESYKVALEHLNQLLANAPENTDYLTMRCRILGNRGMTDLVLAGSERAAETYVEAIESVEKLIRVAGATLDRTKEVARLNGNLADAVAVTEDKERELTHRRRAISLLKELVVDHQQEGADQFIGVHAVRLTMTLLRLQREDEALRELQDITTYCEQIESGETHNSGQQFNAAKCLVFLSEHEPDRYKSDSLAFRAVVVLRGMRKSGFFQREPHLIQQLESEPWVDKLRERTDFRELLTELSAVSRADPS
jgi:tetratricopeptide (TPR) repeat protein